MRAEFGLQPKRRSAYDDLGRKTVRVNFVALRNEDRVRQSLGGDFGAVIFEVAGIALEFFVRPELPRIDEDADHPPAAALPGLGDEREMPHMQGAHGRNETNPRAFAPPAADSCAQVA